MTIDWRGEVVVVTGSGTGVRAALVPARVHGARVVDNDSRGELWAARARPKAGAG